MKLRAVAAGLLLSTLAGTAGWATPGGAEAERITRFQSQLGSVVRQTRLDALLRLTSEDLLGIEALRAIVMELEARGADGAPGIDRALTAVLRCRLEYRAARRSAAAGACARALRLARASDDPLLLLTALRVEGFRRSDDGDPAEAVKLLREALRIGERERNDYAIATALNSLGVVADNVGAVKESTQYYLAALRHSLRAGAIGYTAIIETNIGLLNYLNGSFAVALEWLDRARPRADSEGNRQLVFIIDTARAGCFAGLDRAADARALLDAALASMGGEVEPKFRANAHRTAADVALRVGDWAEAERHARQGIAESVAFPYRTAMLHFPLVAALRGTGRANEAMAVVDELLAVTPIFPTLYTNALVLRAELLADSGSTAEAYAVMREVDARRTQAVIGSIPQQAQFVRAQLQADLLDRPLAQVERRAVSSERDAERAHQLRDASLAFAALVTIAAMLLWRIREERRGRELQRELRATIEQKTRDLEAAMLERRELERDLERRDRLEAVGRLAGGIAHDFNNLMTIVMQCSELLARRPVIGADSAARDLLDECLRAARTGGEISQQLVAFARQQPLAPATRPLDEFLVRAGPLLERAAGDGRRVEFDVPHDAPSVALDEGLFTTALINLVINARDATAPGGRIAIRVRRRYIDAPEVRWPTLSPGSWVEIAVIDDGCGMPADVRRRAIEPFFSTKHESAGAGLGLSMAHGLAVQLGGDLAIDSVPGTGTTIRILLPEVTAAAGPVALVANAS